MDASGQHTHTHGPRQRDLNPHRKQRTRRLDNKQSPHQRRLASLHAQNRGGRGQALERSGVARCDAVLRGGARRGANGALPCLRRSSAEGAYQWSHLSPQHRIRDAARTRAPRLPSAHVTPDTSERESESEKARARTGIRPLHTAPLHDRLPAHHMSHLQTMCPGYIYIYDILHQSHTPPTSCCGCDCHHHCDGYCYCYCTAPFRTALHVLLKPDPSGVTAGDCPLFHKVFRSCQRFFKVSKMRFFL